MIFLRIPADLQEFNPLKLHALGCNSKYRVFGKYEPMSNRAALTPGYHENTSDHVVFFPWQRGLRTSRMFGWSPR